MSIISKSYKVKNVTIHTLTKDTSKDEIEKTLKAFWKGDVTRNVIWDALEFMGDFSSSQLEQMATYSTIFSNRHKERESGKTAIVVSSDLLFGLSRVVELHSDVSGYSHETMVFRTMDKAFEWLEIEGVKDVTD